MYSCICPRLSCFLDNGDSLQIISTDYIHSSLLYICRKGKLNLYHKGVALVLSRLPQGAPPNALQLLEYAGLNIPNLHNVPQVGCFGQQQPPTQQLGPAPTPPPPVFPNQPDCNVTVYDYNGYSYYSYDEQCECSVLGDEIVCDPT